MKKLVVFIVLSKVSVSKSERMCGQIRMAEDKDTLKMLAIKPAQRNF